MKIIRDDLLCVRNGLIVHGCNCSGGFGSGVAGAILKKYPIVAQSYNACFENKSYRPELLGHVQSVDFTGGSFVIVNGFTQLKYGSDGLVYADRNAVQNVLTRASDLAYLYGFKTVNMPKIGCGLGGLSWELDIHPMVIAIEKLVGEKFVVWEI